MGPFGKAIIKHREYMPGIEQIALVADAAMQAADASEVIRKNLAIKDNVILAGDSEYKLTPDSKFILVSLGKAASDMTRAAMQIAGGRITRGLCIPKHAPLDNFHYPNIDLVVGNHPVPGAGSLEAGQRIRDVVGGLCPDDLVLVLLSGGGSSLAVLPAEGITLEDIQQTTRVLLRAGATINEINTVRKHLDQVKGGGLLKMSDPARVVTLILSDVVGNPLDVIASGPTVPDPTTYWQALEIVEGASAFGEIPTAVKDYLDRGARGFLPETLKPEDQTTRLGINRIVGSNQVSCDAAAAAARALGFRAEVLTTSLTGEARQVGTQLVELAKARANDERPFVLILGGETTVTLRGNGIGGRNLEVALGAVEGFAGLRSMYLVTCATDGEDGTSGCAGAIVDGYSLERAKNSGLEPLDYLNENNSKEFFDRLGDSLVTGPSGTNVNDITFILGL